MASTVIACCQLAPVLGDPAANRELAVVAISEAVRRDASVVVLPELMSSGYVFESRAEAAACAERADGETVSLWAKLAAGHGIVIVGGFCEAVSDDVYNSAALVDGSGLRSVYRKAHLWDDEPRWFSAGCAEPPVVDTEFGRIGMMICYDLEFPEWVRVAALSGADLIAVPVNWPASSSPAPPGERSGEVVAAQAAAAANGMFVAVADRCGTERGVDWLGGSVIVSRGGYPAAGPVGENRAAVLTATMDLRLARDKRISDLNDLFADRRPDLYARLWGIA